MLKDFKPFIALLSILVLPILGRAAEPPATVTIPISEYLELKKSTEKPSITTLEDVKITGEFGGKMDIVWNGAATGKFEAISALQETPGLSLSGCSGQALLHTEENVVQIVPQAPRFKLTCHVVPKTWQNFNLTVLNALFLQVDVKGTDLVRGDDSISSRTIGFRPAEKRHLAEAPVNEEPSFVGRYQISILPEESKFHYVIYVNNPNRSPRSFQLKWSNHEVVSSIEGPNPYEENDGGPIFKLMPGTSQIRVTGRFSSNQFISPLGTKALEYLMLDNHPMLALETKGSSRRVSVKEAGMSPSYLGARAFLLGANETVGWQSKALDVFSSLTYTVTQASYHYYLSTQSSPLVEASFIFDNQGSPEIPIKIPGKATYLEVNGVPQVLTKDKDAQLLVRLPTGTGQNVLVQYQAETPPARTIASISTDLARPESLMSNVRVNLQVAEKENYVFARALDGFHARWKWQNLLWALFGLLFCRWFFGTMNWRSFNAWLGASVVGVSIGFYDYSIFFFVFIAALVGLVHYRQRILTYRPPTWRSWFGWGAFACLFACLLYLFSMTSERMQAKTTSLETSISNYQDPQGFSGAGGGSYRGQSALASANKTGLMHEERVKKALRQQVFAAGAAVAPPPPPGLATEDGAAVEDLTSADDMPADAEPVVAGAVDTYQGLPAKIMMPSDGEWLSFSTGMVAKDSNLHLQMFAVANWMAEMIFFFGTVLLLWALWQERRAIKKYIIN